MPPPCRRGAYRAEPHASTQEFPNDRQARRAERHADPDSCVLCFTVYDTSP